MAQLCIKNIQGSNWKLKKSHYSNPQWCVREWIVKKC